MGFIQIWRFVDSIIFLNFKIKKNVFHKIVWPPYANYEVQSIIHFDTIFDTMLDQNDV